MGVTEILTPDSVSVATEAEGLVRTKTEAIHRLSALLARGQSGVGAAEIEHILTERERLQSTGVGGGVAIPHGTIDRLERSVGAVLLCPHAIEFDAIDRAPVTILFAVVAPKRATGEHLKTLARISRLLRDDSFRHRLLHAAGGHEAYALIAAEEGEEPDAVSGPRDRAESKAEEAPGRSAAPPPPESIADAVAPNTLHAGGHGVARNPTPIPPPSSRRPEAMLPIVPPVLSVRQLMSDAGLGVELTLLAGEAGLNRVVRNARIQKSGLALVGHFHGIVPSRVQILGQTELSFLHRLDPADRTRSIRGFFKLGLACVIVTTGMRSHEEGSGNGILPVQELVACAEESETPLLLAEERSSITINALHALLDDRLAPRVRLHGVLVDVFGVGLLLVGSSAIGKSESALDLVMRGHRLVADDVVECDYRPPGMVFGAAADLLRYHLEVRGLGILNIKDLFGVTAIRERKRIDVVVKLVEWSKDTEYDRLGLDDRYHAILGVPIRELVIPVRPGRDMASILEVAARNELLKNAGHHAAREFFGNIEGALVSERPQDESGVLPPVRVAPPSSGVPGERWSQPGHAPSHTAGAQIRASVLSSEIPPARKPRGGA